MMITSITRTHARTHRTPAFSPPAIAPPQSAANASVSILRRAVEGAAIPRLDSNVVSSRNPPRSTTTLSSNLDHSQRNGALLGCEKETSAKRSKLLCCKPVHKLLLLCHRTRLLWHLCYFLSILFFRHLSMDLLHLTQSLTEPRTVKPGSVAPLYFSLFRKILFRTFSFTCIFFVWSCPCPHRTRSRRKKETRYSIWAVGPSRRPSSSCRNLIGRLAMDQSDCSAKLSTAWPLRPWNPLCVRRDFGPQGSTCTCSQSLCGSQYAAQSTCCSFGGAGRGYSEWTHRGSVDAAW